MLKFKKLFSTLVLYNTSRNKISTKYIDIYLKYFQLRKLDVKTYISSNHKDFFKEGNIIILQENSKKCENEIDVKRYNNIIENAITKMNWPEKINNDIKNLIGKDMGCEVFFKLFSDNEEFIISIYTNEYEKLYGVSFIIIKEGYVYNNHQFICDKTYYAINPINNEKIPIIILNNIKENIELGIPGHNNNHYLIAKNHNYRIKYVMVNNLNDAIAGIRPKEPLISNIGYIINSNEFDYLSIDEAKILFLNYLERNLLGKPVIKYKINKIKFKDHNFILSHFNQIIDFKKNSFHIDLTISNNSDSYNILVFCYLYRYYLEKNNIDIERIIRDEQENNETLGSSKIYLPLPFKNIIIENEELMNKLYKLNEIKLNSYSNNESQDILAELHEIKDNTIFIIENLLKLINNIDNYQIDKSIDLLLIIPENLNNHIKFPSAYYYLYTCFLILLYPFNSILANNLYSSIKNIQINIPQSITNYDANKINETLRYFLFHLKNKKKLKIFKDEKLILNYYLDKTNIDIKLLISDFLKSNSISYSNIDMKNKSVIYIY
jgi:hypothetical protein